MDREQLINAIQNGRIEWQTHALERMMKRGISTQIVKQVLLEGEIIEDYPDDKPFPTIVVPRQRRRLSYSLMTKDFHTCLFRC